MEAEDDEDGGVPVPDTLVHLEGPHHGDHLQLAQALVHVSLGSKLK